MPMQKLIKANPADSKQISMLFHLGQALADDGWGVTVVANADTAQLTTNAPSKILDFHTTVQAYHLTV